MLEHHMSVARLRKILIKHLVIYILLECGHAQSVHHSMHC